MSIVIAMGGGLVLVTAALVLSRLSVAQIAYVSVGALVMLVSWDGIRFAGGSFANIFFVLAFLATLLHIIVDRVPVRLPPWLLGAAGLLLCAALVTATSPPNPAVLNQSSLEYLQMYSVSDIAVTSLVGPRSNVSALITWEIGLVILPAIIIVIAQTPARITRLLDLWTIGTSINALVGVLDVLGFHFLAAGPEIGHRSVGLTVHPNYLALTCVFGIPTAARMINTTPRRTILGIVALATLLGGAYSSGSRDGTATAVIIVLLCLVALPRARFLLRYAVPLAAVAVGAALLVPSVGHAISTQLRLTGSGSGDVSINGSNYQHVVFTHVAEQQFDARPVSGVGMAEDNDAQNIYLQTLAAGGLIAMLGLVVLLGGLWVSLRRTFRTHLATDATAAGVAIVGWMINGYFDSQLADKYLYVLPGILIACAQVARAERLAAADVEVPLPVSGPLQLPASLQPASG